MDNLRGLLGIRRMDRVPNEWMKGLMKTCFGHVERMENGRISKKVYW